MAEFQISEEDATIRNLKGMRMFLSDSEYKELSPEKKDYYESTPVTMEYKQPEEEQGDNDKIYHYPENDYKYQLKSEYIESFRKANPRENPENVGGKRRKSRKSRKSKKSRKFKRKSIKKSKRRYRK
uniref:Uncharacterized protein n=1 Tax=viral metagenome TaxID=1070528 RepID=A0A6C0CVC3_9ZZZZ